MGGLAENKLKKLNGLRFTLPALSIVEANAIGRGAIACCRKYCFSEGERSFNCTFITFLD
jgi:hypothetical protein